MGRKKESLDGQAKSIPVSVRRRIWDMPCTVCGDCGDIEVDHIVPVSCGGSRDESNLQPLCRVCNAIKSDRRTNAEIADWIANNRGLFLARKESRALRARLVMSGEYF